MVNYFLLEIKIDMGKMLHNLVLKVCNSGPGIQALGMLFVPFSVDVFTKVDHKNGDKNGSPY